MKSTAALALTPTARATRDVLLTPAEVGAWLKCSPRQVARLGIASLQLGARKLRRYREVDVASWIASQVRAPHRNGRGR